MNLDYTSIDSISRHRITRKKKHAWRMKNNEKRMNATETRYLFHLKNKAFGFHSIIKKNKCRGDVFMKYCPRCDNLMFVRKIKNKNSKTKFSRKLVCNACGYMEDLENGNIAEMKKLYTIKKKLNHGIQDRTPVIRRFSFQRAVTVEDREANEWMFQGYAAT
ncbi:MAG: hypothetical protein ACTSVI_03075 [Promethearchaeota archaeon]